MTQIPSSQTEPPTTPTAVITVPSGNTVPTRNTSAGRRPSRRWLLWSLLLVVVGIGVGLVLRRGSAAPDLTYATDVTVQGTVSVLVSGPGTLAPRKSTPDPAPTSGTVNGLPPVGTVLKAGQMVGQLQNDGNAQAVQDAQLALQKALAQLSAQQASQAAVKASRASNSTSAQLSVQDAQDTLSTAQSTLENQTRLYGVGAISRTDLQSAQNTVQSAQNKLASAQAALSSARQQTSTGLTSDNSTLETLRLAIDQARNGLQQARQTVAKQILRAPVSGVITSVEAVNGSNISAGASLLTVADTSAMELPVQIDETQISQVKLGLLARVTLDALDGQTLEGKVTAISPAATVQNNISVFTVNVELPNPSGLLRVGMSAQSDIVIAEENGLVVPTKAVQSVRARSYVQVLPASTLQTASMLAPQSTAMASQSTQNQSASQVNGQGSATAVQTRVQLGLSDGTSTIVTGGLQEGDALLLPAVTAQSSRSSPASSGAVPGINLGTGGSGSGGGFRNGN